MENELNIKIIKRDNLYIDESDDFIDIKELEDEYVSKGIRDDYKYWTRETPVFISAQTGKGKNHFIEESIITHALENSYNVLIISNRIANNRQMKKRIIELTDCTDILRKYTPEGLDEIEDFKNISVLSYQKLGGYLNNITYKEKLHKYSYVIFDECHFFISDSLFNKNTYSILKSSIKKFQNAVRIYMTATPDEILPVIINIEKQNINRGFNAINRMNSFNNYTPYYIENKLLYYIFKRNYSYVQPKPFNKIEEIIDKIKKDANDEKWLIFVTNKEDGLSIEKNLNEPTISTKKSKDNTNGNIAVFVNTTSRTSSDKDGKVYTQIIDNNKFNCKVLISTSTFDNGVNFNDDNLKNIVIIQYDKIEFLQMLGRKRVNRDEYINLYIWTATNNHFLGKLRSANNQLTAIKYYNNHYSEFVDKYVNSTTKEHDLQKQLFFYINNNNNYGKFYYNKLAEIKLEIDKSFYMKMIPALTNDKNAYYTEQLSWLGINYESNQYLNNNSTKNIDNLIKYIDRFLGNSLTKSEFNKFAIKFKELSILAFGKQNGDRNDRSYGVTKIRKIFKNNNLNYELRSKNEEYTLLKSIKQ